eukprot:9500563-Pyramimonas_sp.AAC.1
MNSSAEVSPRILSMPGGPIITKLPEAVNTRTSAVVTAFHANKKVRTVTAGEGQHAMAQRHKHTFV